MDRLTKAQRSANMFAIKGKNTRPELAVRRCAHGAGLRFRLHSANLPGSPDLVFPKHMTVIFVHGCFWHQHMSRRCGARLPKSNTKYWTAKLARNVTRDKENGRRLRALGWHVLVIWECQTKDRETLLLILKKFFAKIEVSSGSRNL